MKKGNKIITSVVALAFCFSVVSPASAGYRTVYVPNSYNTTGQTIIYQNTSTQPIVVQQPTQTIVVQEQQPVQTVYVNETTTYSDDALWAAGIGTLVGGVILGSIWHHDHKKSHYKPQPPKHSNKHHIGGKPNGNKHHANNKPKGSKPSGNKPKGDKKHK